MYPQCAVVTWIIVRIQDFLDIEKKWNSPYAIIARALQLASQQLEFITQQSNCLSEINYAQAQMIEEMKPKASYYYVVLNSEGLMPINTIAKNYGKSAVWLNKWLHEHGVVLHYI